MDTRVPPTLDHAGAVEGALSDHLRRARTADRRRSTRMAHRRWRVPHIPCADRRIRGARRQPHRAAPDRFRPHRPHPRQSTLALDAPCGICIAEVFGNSVASNAAKVRVGIKAHHDPRLTTDVRDVSVPIDATRPHTYGAEWGATGCAIPVDGTQIYRTDQVLAYPLQLMLDIWEFPEGPRLAGAYPLSATIDEVCRRADA